MPSTPKPNSVIESRPSHTKIVATIGPASSSVDQLVGLMQAGVDVFRLNMAHGGPTEQETRLAAIRTASANVGRPVAVLADLAGPKIRLGELPDGQLTCNAGDRLRFVRTLPLGDGPSEAAGGTSLSGHRRAALVDEGRGLPDSHALRASGTCHPTPGEGRAASSLCELTVTYEPLLDELAVDDRILLADGTVSLVVETVGTNYAECRVVQPGVIRSRQGVNLPGVKLSVAAMSDVDRQNAVWAAQVGIDFVGLSFVRKPDDVLQLKSLLAEHNPEVQVIAKIEKPEALEQLEAIAAVADGVMVARGDLGVEIDIAGVAVAQKKIIAMCNRLRKPVIVATQMLDSMTHSRIPTRAEVADVSNAILDGADACMLSGETAVGEYPRETVEMMHRIALETEQLYTDGSHREGNSRGLTARGLCDEAAYRNALPTERGLLAPGYSTEDRIATLLNPITETTVSAAGHIAEDLNAKMVIVATASGATALSMAKNRHFVPTLGVSDSAATLRRMCLYWGVIPLAGAPTGDSAALLRHVTNLGRTASLLHAGDRIVLVSGTGLAVTRHNMIVVHELE